MTDDRIIFLAIVFLAILFAGDPDLMDAIITWVSCD